MKEKTKQYVSLNVQADAVFLPLATSFVENAAVGLGLGHAEALSLTLATEEIFSYLCQMALPDQAIEIRCSSGGYYVRADFHFSVKDFNMRAFNLTATVSVDDEASLEEMGLLIASRSVERFQIAEEKGRGVQLTLVKEKKYPASDEETVPPSRPLPEFSIQGPNPEEVKLFTLLVNRHYQGKVIPGFFKFPGKVVDMVNEGEYQAALALGPTGQMGGGIVWHWAGLNTVECFGPYLFKQNPDSNMANDLLEACLGAIARTHAVGLISRYPTEDLPQEHFEPLGSLTIFNQEGSTTSLTSYFRQMQEDPGTSVWSHTELEFFLREEYARLVLPREIRLVKDLGETKSPFSVLSAEFDRSQMIVTLRPIRPGADADKNMANHLKLFTEESLRSVFFEMDLAQPWQTEFTPTLLKNGFTPRLVLPYAGQGDLVIFQLGDKLS
ncbi:MAG: hypothetical protein JRJ11_11990 [Deltaproteobacteria bacterium]|nr:hypothetical protein [Deltaproteobacteria bacterium]